MKTPSSSAGHGKTLIVHVGDHKTGSTSIPNAFASGRVTLPGHSVLYPGNLDHNRGESPGNVVWRTNRAKTVE